MAGRLPAVVCRHGAEPGSQADRRSPARGRHGPRRGDRHPHRPDPHPGRHRHHGHARAGGHGAPSGPNRGLGPVRRPQPAPGRLQERRRSPVPAQRLAALRRLVLQARQRGEPSCPPTALRRAGQDHARLRQPHPGGGLHWHAGHRCGRPRGGDGHGRTALLHHHAQGLGRPPGGPAPRLGQRQGHDLGDAPPPRRQWRAGVHPGVPRARPGGAECHGPPRHRQHGCRVGRHHHGVPERRRGAPLPRVGRAGRRLGGAGGRPGCWLRHRGGDRPLRSGTTHRQALQPRQRGAGARSGGGRGVPGGAGLVGQPRAARSGRARFDGGGPPGARPGQLRRQPCLPPDRGDAGRRGLPAPPPRRRRPAPPVGVHGLHRHGPGPGHRQDQPSHHAS